MVCTTEYRMGRACSHGCLCNFKFSSNQGLATEFWQYLQILILLHNIADKQHYEVDTQYIHVAPGTDWSVDKWLQSINFGEYIDNFKKEGYDRLESVSLKTAAYCHFSFICVPQQRVMKEPTAGAAAGV